MKYFKEYLGLVILVIAVIVAEPLMAAFYEFTATTAPATDKKEGSMNRFSIPRIRRRAPVMESFSERMTRQTIPSYTQWPRI